MALIKDAAEKCSFSLSKILNDNALIGLLAAARSTRIIQKYLIANRLLIDLHFYDKNDLM